MPRFQANGRPKKVNGWAVHEQVGPHSFDIRVVADRLSRNDAEAIARALNGSFPIGLPSPPSEDEGATATGPGGVLVPPFPPSNPNDRSTK